mmetsp:Transcript_116386/g.202389  ORF Transcript_116386/g.202389 Transcript_116386/m.202389 type:complete len:378 (-) Transcript_116386:686-1819(-)
MSLRAETPRSELAPSPIHPIPEMFDDFITPQRRLSRFPGKEEFQPQTLVTIGNTSVCQYHDQGSGPSAPPISQLGSHLGYQPAMPYSAPQAVGYSPFASPYVRQYTPSSPYMPTFHFNQPTVSYGASAPSVATPRPGALVPWSPYGATQQGIGQFGKFGSYNPYGQPSAAYAAFDLNARFGSVPAQQYSPSYNVPFANYSSLAPQYAPAAPAPWSAVDDAPMKPFATSKGKASLYTSISYTHNTPTAYTGVQQMAYTSPTPAAVSYNPSYGFTGHTHSMTYAHPSFLGTPVSSAASAVPAVQHQHTAAAPSFASYGMPPEATLTYGPPMNPQFASYSSSAAGPWQDKEEEKRRLPADLIPEDPEPSTATPTNKLPTP